ncbi:MAG: hypothetical protein U5L45_01360 [Saprospiraceae bacterium]|nr:hypothetical protein [Saprospiraceae bacterium]
MWFVFRLRRKTNHVSSLLRERSERKTSVFNQKTMFLGYAHSSIILLYKFLFRQETGFFSLRLREEEECGSFFGLCPKNEPPLLSLHERSERKERK